MVVLSDYGCSTSVFTNAPSDCAVSRGTLFNANQSSSWYDLGLFSINENGVGLEVNLGGIFGLNPQPVNFTSLGNFSSPSFLTTLKNQGKIPSLSWSYTAGAQYRLKQVYGQLIFSGYDTSRFVENSVSFTMAGDITRDLVVYLQSISYSGSTSATLLSDPILTFIDSTDPNLWMPGVSATPSRRPSGLQWTPRVVSFRLSDVATGGAAVTITLPYNAFALTAKAPLVNSSSHYFPLKRAANSTQYTLGRVFLQEAYLSVDYERNTFNVSACSWNENSQQDIVTITSKDSGSTSCAGSACSSGTNSSGDSSPLSRGTVAGIAIAALVGVGILAAILFFFIRRQRQKTAYKATPPEPDVSVLSGPVHNAPPSGPSDQSSPQPPFWSPDAIFGGVSDSNNGRSNNGHSSGSGRTHEQSVDDRGMELDGHGTQITPVYHELPGSAVEKTRPEPELERPNTPYV
ncbi:uncharacterized protein N7458_003281 [Penicillium daleae]|uniref:Peptidase A1 domain-containing protein n=1 Tax=Penicillium daleae TaxID=63821 RepID=A0AAD6CEM2_9EURO|nr:uncharacterized protein N7458_003281 [Penicillium daleae]KAJ5461729.1 hypothetical protein N7458_003281 [Penicillium daleae]